MVKSIGWLFVFLIFLAGCGGSGGDSSSSQINDPDDQSNSPGQTVSSGFKYPQLFNGDQLFFESVKTKRVGGLLTAIFEADKLTIYNAAQVVANVEVSVHAPLNLIGENVSRANCEKGSLVAISFSGLNEGPSFGEFKMTDFSGVGLKITGADEECPSSYFDGYIKYNFSDNPNGISMKFGNIATEPEPFFFSDESGFADGAFGYLGGGNLEYPNKKSMVFKTGEDQFLETLNVKPLAAQYNRSAYTITSSIKLSNVNISSIDDGVKTKINAHYIREWKELGEKFKLLTDIRNLTYSDIDNRITSGFVEYKLEVEGKPNRYVNATAVYGSDVAATFVKEGFTTSRNY